MEKLRFLRKVNDSRSVFAWTKPSSGIQKKTDIKSDTDFGRSFCKRIPGFCFDMIFVNVVVIVASD